jgi:hypothetical protein
VTDAKHNSSVKLSSIKIKSILPTLANGDDLSQLESHAFFSTGIGRQY